MLTIARVYLQGMESRGKILYPLFLGLISLLEGVIVVPALRCGTKLAGALAANESAERSRGGGVSGVTTSLLRPITHARRGRFSRALKDEKERVTVVI